MGVFTFLLILGGALAGLTALASICGSGSYTPTTREYYRERDVYGYYTGSYLGRDRVYY